MSFCPNVNMDIYAQYRVVSCLATGTGGGDYTNAYCLNGDVCGYCPIMGGDNRILNRDCLTEEVCASLYSAASRAVDYTSQMLSQTLGEVSRLISQTGYVLLADYVAQPAQSFISIPSISGRICSIVQTAPEADRASVLESDINSKMWSAQPKDYFTPPYMDGVPRISTDDFNRIAGEINRCGQQCAYVGASVGSGLYYSEISDTLSALGSEISAYFNRIAQAVYSAREVFDSGSGSVFSQTGNHTGYHGSVPGFF